MCYDKNTGKELSDIELGGGKEMERHAFAMQIKEGRINHTGESRRIWPELTAFLDAARIRNFSIWNAEDLIFG